MIDFVSCGGADPRCATRPFGFYDNVQKTTSDGVELGLVAQLGERLRVTANYTSLEAQNAARDNVNFDRELARRPKQTANANLSYTWPIGLATTVAVRHAGRSFDDPANTVALEAYTLVDLRATYTVSDSLEVFGRLENAFDETYRTAGQYGTIGRGLFVGVRQAF
jgi:vitamin B12 transporter